MECLKKILRFINPNYTYAEFQRLKYKIIFKGVRVGLYSRIHKSEIEECVFIGSNTVINNSKIGRHTYINSESSISNVKCGNFCSIGSEVVMGLGIHPVQFVSTHPAFYSNNKAFKTYADKVYIEEYKTIEIGNDVWIGFRAIIVDGVKIGDGAIIAANAVVTKDVPPFAIVGGVPAKVIKYRFENDIILKIIKTNWWNKDEIWLQENYKHFMDFQKFLNTFEE